MALELSHTGLKLGLLFVGAMLMLSRHPEFFADVQKFYLSIVSDSSRAFSLLLVAVGLFSAYKKLRRRALLEKTAGGAGMRLDVEDSVWRVMEVVDGSPASEVGVRVGDAVTHVDGKPVTELPSISVIRGRVGSEVCINVTRIGEDGKTEDLSFRLVRRSIVAANLKQLGPIAPAGSVSEGEKAKEE